MANPVPGSPSIVLPGQTPAGAPAFPPAAAPTPPGMTMPGAAPVTPTAAPAAAGVVLPNRAPMPGVAVPAPAPAPSPTPPMMPGAPLPPPPMPPLGNPVASPPNPPPTLGGAPAPTAPAPAAPGVGGATPPVTPPPTETKPKFDLKKNLPLVILLGVLVLLIVGGGIYLLVSGGGKKTPPPTPTPSPTATPMPTPTPTPAAAANASCYTPDSMANKEIAEELAEQIETNYLVLPTGQTLSDGSDPEAWFNYFYGGDSYSENGGCFRPEYCVNTPRQNLTYALDFTWKNYGRALAQSTNSFVPAAAPIAAADFTSAVQKNFGITQADLKLLPAYEASSATVLPPEPAADSSRPYRFNLIEVRRDPNTARGDKLAFIAEAVSDGSCVLVFDSVRCSCPQARYYLLVDYDSSLDQMIMTQEFIVPSEAMKKLN